ncbi:hypothetical protein [Streptomyces sp. NPDC058657]|uniref:hypothetical protein n=1 Tax=unclassified Streptomyces TaxID=2593676 RepID=UPI0036689C6E
MGGDDDNPCGNAWLRLFNAVFHRGSRYLASAAAVPYFARIATIGRHARTGAAGARSR